MITIEKKSPFKFLDPYIKADRSFFFGRDKEIRTLYEFVNKNRVVLIYGQSGTGKTSIVQCGLANEFEVTDWMPFFIRRGDNLNNSLANCINKSVESSNTDEIAGLMKVLFGDGTSATKNTTYTEKEKTYITGLIYNIHKITETYLRPIYLIFDQFEELLILAQDDEKQLFIKMLKILLSPSSMMDCHVIIVMREEYFAWLDAFEKDIPGLSDRRLRIEPMRRTKIKSVIIESCANFNITLLNPEADAEQIINALSKREAEVSLPYLQVYLDQLWRIDYHRTYPQGDSGTRFPPPLEFTAEEITELGEIKDVLQRFLHEQKTELQKKLEDFENVPFQFINKLLDCFVNEQGTKIPHVFEFVDGFYVFRSRASRLFHETDSTLLKFALDFLQSSQIIRNEGNNLELGHDILAKLIDSQRDAKIQKLNSIPVIVQYYRKDNKLIPHEIITDWDQYRSEMQLKKEDDEWYQKSRNAWEAEEEHKYLSKHRKKRNAILISLVAVTIASLSYLVYLGIKPPDIERANSLISKKITRKNDHLLLLKDAYDKGGYDDDAKTALRNAIMSIVQGAEYAKETATANFTIESSASLMEGLDIDISSNGKYISIRKKEAPQYDTLANFILYDVARNKAVHDFSDVKYAYFLSNSDTLFVALRNTASKVLADSPNRFILYDCSNNTLIDTVDLNQPGYINYALYNKDYINRTTYSQRDSYKVRRMASGKLLVPCLNNSHLAKNGKGIFDIKYDSPLILVSNSQYSISTSPNNSQFMYCTENKNRFEFNIYDDFTSKTTPFKPIPNSYFRKNETAVFADFTEDNSIVFNQNNTLHLEKDGNVIKYPLSKTVTTVFSGVNSKYLLASDIDNQYVYLLDYQENLNNDSIKATIVGYNFDSLTFISQEMDTTSYKVGVSRLVVHDFNKKAARPRKVEKLIESIKFNSQSGCILVKAKHSPESPLQLLYLYDNRLSLKASYYITPNDTYAFSNSGKNFYIVRDKELLIFKNEVGADLTSFDTVNKMLDDEKAYSER